jgi:hypothetical protein
MEQDHVANVKGKALLVESKVGHSQVVKIPRRNATHALKRVKDAAEAGRVVSASSIIRDVEIKGNP